MRPICRLQTILIFTCLTAYAAAAHAAPGANQFFPFANAAGVCPDTPLRLTFPVPPTLTKTGKIQIFDAATNTAVETIDTASPTATQTIGGLPNYKYYPVIITANDATIYPRDGALAYNKTYYVTIDPGVFKDDLGITDPAAWRFTTKSVAPARDATRLTVAANGSGDFCTVQGAIDFLPDNNKTPTTIFIRKGIYTELISFANKNALTFSGEDRTQTIIQYADNANFNNAKGVYHRGVFLANHCDDLTLTNLTIHNTTPFGGSQAEAIIFNGTPTARAVVSNVDLYSHQDTLQINGQAYISNCHIEGDVDFMWGTGPCYFENCQCISLRSKAFYTQIRNTDKNHGYVYHNCLFAGATGVTGNFLSRIDPKRFPHSEVVLLDCTLTESVGPVAWRLDVNKDAPTIHFWEYNSHTPDGKPIDASRRLPASRQLDEKADAQTIADYTNPTFVLGNNWSPPQSAAQSSEPETVKITYRVAPGKEQELQNTLAAAWAVYQERHLVYSLPHVVTSLKEEGGKISITEIFTWVSHDAPGHAPDVVKTLWAKRQSLCESRDGHPGLDGGELNASASAVAR